MSFSTSHPNPEAFSNKSLVDLGKNCKRLKSKLKRKRAEKETEGGMMISSDTASSRFNHDFKKSVSGCKQTITGYLLIYHT